VENKKGRLTLITIFKPDTKEELYMNMGDENSFILNGSEPDSEDFWAIVSSYYDDKKS
jgi:hypothetical protein